MLNVPLASVDAVARPVLAIGTDYPPDTLLPTHVHRRAQFLYGMSGLMEVQTQDGSWVIPPGSGVWIPAGKPHQVLMPWWSRPCSTTCCWPRRTYPHCMKHAVATGI
jgi:hypothetical protein